MPTWTESQQAVIDHKKKNLLVSAAAGSGKTAVMIEHIFKAVTEENISLDRMLVATYTNAAAASMKEKLKEKFDWKIAENPQNVNLVKQKQLIERADISTIHSFCIKTLRKYYFCTPLPPDFRIFESTQRKMFSISAAGQILEEAAKEYNDGLFPQYGDVLLQFSDAKSDFSLEKLILDLDEATQSMPHPQEFKEYALSLYGDTSKYVDFVFSYCKDLLNSAIDHAVNVIKKFSQTEIADDTQKLMDVYINMFNDAVFAPDIYTMNQFLAQKLNTPRGKSTPLRKAMVQNTVLLKEIRSKVRKMTDEIDETDLSFLVPAVEGLFQLHTRYNQRLETLMLDGGGTDFTGVLRYMAKLIEENENIRQDLKNNIDRIYIDEYQDTNAFQDYIINSISSGENMFFVGDIKQSIYGFQHARPALFREKMETYAQGENGDRINLKNNFRSYPQILEGVNFIFKNLMIDKNISEIIYDDDACLYPSPDGEYKQHRDCLYKDDMAQCANELMVVVGDGESEANAIALKIKELLNYTLYDKGILRPVRYGDIVILGRTKKIGERFSEVFSLMNIPFSQQEKEKPDNSDTTATIIALLNLLILRRSDIDLVTVLLSNMGGFTPTELGKIRNENKFVSLYDALIAYDKSPKIKNKIKEFFELLDKLELLQKSMAIADFIEYLSNETGYIYHTAYLPKSSREQESFNRLVASARSFSEFSDRGLVGFLEYYQNISEPQTDGFTIDGKNNTVHFMTIHKSKGLEFPIVILAGCADTPWSPNNPYSFDENQGFAFKYNTVDEFNLRTKHVSIASRAVEISQTKLDIAESMRIFYVALTRAEKKLILCVTDTEKGLCERCILPSKAMLKTHKNYADVILPLIYNHRDGENLRQYLSDAPFVLENNLFEDSQWQVDIYQNVLLTETDEVVNEVADFDEISYIKKVEESFSWKYPYLSATTQRTKQSPSKKQIRTKIPLRKPMFEDKEYKGAQKGTVVHFFMEHISFESEKSAKTQAEEMLYSGILSKEEFDALPFDQLDAFMTSPFAKRMRNSELICRERSFCQIIPFDETCDEALVQGIIDCYFFEGDDIILLDYKTDFINNDLNEHIIHHTPQLNMYKAALEELYPGKKVYPYIHFFHVNKTVEIT